MGVHDVRKVIQDLVAPELKSLAVKLDSMESESKLRDENLAAKIESAEREAKVRDELTQAKLETVKAKMEGLSVKMDAQYQSLLYNLNLEKRVGLLGARQAVHFGAVIHLGRAANLYMLPFRPTSRAAEFHALRVQVLHQRCLWDVRAG